jgi:hypothetical protein
MRNNGERVVSPCAYRENFSNAQLKAHAFQPRYADFRRAPSLINAYRFRPTYPAHHIPHAETDIDSPLLRLPAGRSAPYFYDPELCGVVVAWAHPDPLPVSLLGHRYSFRAEIRDVRVKAGQHYAEHLNRRGIASSPAMRTTIFHAQFRIGGIAGVMMFT